MWPSEAQTYLVFHKNEIVIMNWACYYRGNQSGEEISGEKEITNPMEMHYKIIIKIIQLKMF